MAPLSTYPPNPMDRNPPGPIPGQQWSNKSIHVSRGERERVPIISVCHCYPCILYTLYKVDAWIYASNLDLTCVNEQLTKESRQERKQDHTANTTTTMQTANCKMQTANAGTQPGPGLNTVRRCFTTRASGELSYCHSVFFWLRGRYLGAATVGSLYLLWLYV